MVRAPDLHPTEEAPSEALAAPSRCLYCRAPIRPIHSASARCGACSEVNLRVDQKAYWTLAPKAVATEKYLKLIGALATFVAAVTLAKRAAGAIEVGFWVFAVVGLLIPLGLWWDLASLRTRKVSRSRFEVLVPTMFVVCSVFPIGWALFHAMWGQQRDLWAAFVESLGVFLYVQPFALGSWLLVRSMRWLRRQEMDAVGAPLSPSEAASVRRAATHVPKTPASSSSAVRALRATRGLINARPSSSFQAGVRSTKSTSCLHCFAPLPPMTGASQTCPRCQRTTRKVDQAVFWTRHDAMVRTEQRVKAFVVSLMVVAVGAIYLNAARLSETNMFGVPMATALAIAIAALLWDLAGMITRHRSMLRLELFLPLVLSGFGIGAVLFGGIARMGKPSFSRGGINEALDIPWSFSLPFLVAGLLVHQLLRWFFDWREEKRAELILNEP